VRILVTNDDGVHAPGLAALTQALAEWVGHASDQDERSVTVVAPLANHSGASAAVGTVFERESVAYRAAPIEGAAGVPVFGVDAPPALATILGVLGAFGPRPDVVLSGINLGINIGRSILHSGTVGATLTAAQLGVKGLAVSMRAESPYHFETAAQLAVAMLATLHDAPPRTVLNLNVPSCPLTALRGIRHGRISTAGVIKHVARAHDPGSTEPVRGPVSIDAPGSITDSAPRSTGDPAVGALGDSGVVALQLGTAVPSLGDVDDEAPDEDGALIAAGFASITALVGVHEDTSQAADDVVALAVTHALAPRRNTDT
jgi:5'-nucleotidase